MKVLKRKVFNTDYQDDYYDAEPKSIAEMLVEDDGMEVYLTMEYQTDCDDIKKFITLESLLEIEKKISTTKEYGEIEALMDKRYELTSNYVDDGLFDRYEKQFEELSKMLYASYGEE